MFACPSPARGEREARPTAPLEPGPCFLHMPWITSIMCPQGRNRPPGGPVNNREITGRTLFPACCAKGARSARASSPPALVVSIWPATDGRARNQKPAAIGWGGRNSSTVKRCVGKSAIHVPLSMGPQGGQEDVIQQSVRRAHSDHPEDAFTNRLEPAGGMVAVRPPTRRFASDEFTPAEVWQWAPNDVRWPSSGRWPMPNLMTLMNGHIWATPLGFDGRV